MDLCGGAELFRVRQESPHSGALPRVAGASARHSGLQAGHGDDFSPHGRENHHAE